MNLSTTHGHTFDLDNLPEAPIVLDVGCRDFEFTREILRLRPDALVFAMDPDLEMVDPQIKGCTFIRKALVGNMFLKSSIYASFSTGEANFLCGAVPHYAKEQQVRCTHMQELMRDLGIEQWDLVKMDCEGSEFEILENWPGVIAKQISVEFHDFQNPGRWNDAYFERLWHQLPEYKVVQHPSFPIGPDNTVSHWDSLLVMA